MKNFLTMILFSCFMLLNNLCYATVFSQPVQIGSYMTTRKGEPCLAYAAGYTKRTEESFTFGEGKDALSILFKNRHLKYGNDISTTIGILIGNQMCTNILCENIQEIYKITSDDGVLVYLGRGISSGFEITLFVITRNNKGEINYTTIADLYDDMPGLISMHRADSIFLDKPTCVRNFICLPYMYRADDEILMFKWEEERNSYNIMWPADDDKQ